MKILLSWLAEFLPENSLDDKSPSEIGDLMTGLGMVVESIETTGPKVDGVVVAEVVNLREHPNADKVQIVDVNAGEFNNGEETLQICCGAFNMSPGDLVPLATIGTTMANGMEIAQRKMRGVESNGMLCSAEEIGFPASDEKAIMLLESGLEIGTPLVQALNLATDVLFDLDIEGNRPDALNVAGVARDVAAKLGIEFQQKTPTVTEADSKASAVASVNIQVPDLCSRFGIRVLENITIGNSPGWMQQRLTDAGMRPINSIVDISNYVMLELGQPNHTYDLDKVPDGQLVVRMANADEAITTLDDTKRKLSVTDIAVSNNKGEAIGIAGVMGGASTEIGDDSSRILLEAAVWDRMSVARTARSLNLRSEASTRFERGVDYAGIERALDRFCELAIEICGASVLSGQVVAEGNLADQPVVNVRTQRVNQFMSSELSQDQIVNFLEPIGFTTVSKTADSVDVQVS